MLKFTLLYHPVSFSNDKVKWVKAASVYIALAVIYSFSNITCSQWLPNDPASPSFSNYPPGAIEQLK